MVDQHKQKRQRFKQRGTQIARQPLVPAGLQFPFHGRPSKTSIFFESISSAWKKEKGERKAKLFRRKENFSRFPFVVYNGSPKTLRREPRTKSPAKEEDRYGCDHLSGGGGKIRTADVPDQLVHAAQQRGLRRRRTGRAHKGMAEAGYIAR